MLLLQSMQLACTGNISCCRNNNVIFVIELLSCQFAFLEARTVRATHQFSCKGKSEPTAGTSDKIGRHPEIYLGETKID